MGEYIVGFLHGALDLAVEIASPSRIVRMPAEGDGRVL